MGIDDPKPLIAAMLDAPPESKEFQRLLFSKIVPNCRKLGLLDAGEGWLRTKFEEIDVIEFEHLESTDDEYATSLLPNEPPPNRSRGPSSAKRSSSTGLSVDPRGA